VTPFVDDSAKIYFYTKSQKVKGNIRRLMKSDALILFNTKTHDHLRYCASAIIIVMNPDFMNIEKCFNAFKTIRWT